MNAWRVIDSGFLVDIASIHVDKIGTALYYAESLDMFFTTDDVLCDPETPLLHFTRISARRAAVECVQGRIALLQQNLERLEQLGKELSLGDGT